MQKRWLCRDCEREWVFATMWTDGDPCPMCKSENVSSHKYQPVFPGADIPRERTSNLRAPATVTPIEPPLILGLS